MPPNAAESLDASAPASGAVGGLDRLNVLGRDLYFLPGDQTAASLRQGWYEYDALSFVALLLRPGDVFIDVGAYVGLYAALADEVTNGLVNIVAVEANPQLAFLINRNLGRAAPETRARSEAVSRVIMAAVGADTPGARLVLESGGRESQSRLATSFTSPDANAVAVATTTLSDILKGLPESAITLIKLDVDGAELNAIRQSHEALAVRPGLVLLIDASENELRARGASSAELVEELQSLDLSLATFDPTAKILRRWNTTSSLPKSLLIAAKDIDALNRQIAAANLAVSTTVAEFSARGAAAAQLYDGKLLLDRLHSRLSGFASSIGAVEHSLTGSGPVIVEAVDSSSDDFGPSLTSIDASLGRLIGAARKVLTERESLQARNRSLVDEREAFLSRLIRFGDKLSELNDAAGQRFSERISQLRFGQPLSAVADVVGDQFSRISDKLASQSISGPDDAELRAVSERLAASMVRQSELQAELDRVRSENAQTTASAHASAATYTLRTDELKAEIDRLVRRASEMDAVRQSEQASAVDRYKALEERSNERIIHLEKTISELTSAHDAKHEQIALRSSGLEAELDRLRTSAQQSVEAKDRELAAALANNSSMLANIAPLVASFESALAEGSKKDAAVAAAEVRANALTTAIEAAQTEIARKNVLLADTEKSLREANTERNLTRAETSKLIAELSASDATASVLRKELESVRAELGKASGDKHATDALITSLQSKLDAALAELSKKDSVHATTSDQLVAAQADLAGSQTALASMKSQLEADAQRQRDLVSVVEAALAEVARKEKEFEASLSEIAAKDKAVFEFEARARQFESQLEVSRRDASSAKSKLEVANKRHVEFASSAEKALAELSNKDKIIRDLKLEVDRLRSGASPRTEEQSAELDEARRKIKELQAMAHTAAQRAGDRIDALESEVESLRLDAVRLAGSNGHASKAQRAELEQALEKARQDAATQIAKKDKEVAASVSKFQEEAKSAKGRSKELESELSKLRDQLAEIVAERHAETSGLRSRSEELEQQLTVARATVDAAMEELQNGEQRSAEAARIAHDLGELALDLQKSRWLRIGKRFGIRAGDNLEKAVQVYLGDESNKP